MLDITVLDGVILAAAGTRLEVLELKGKTLQRTAFYDAQILLRSVSVIKDYILLGDVHKSLTFVQSSQRCRQLNELSKVCTAGNLPFLHITGIVMRALTLPIS